MPKTPMLRLCADAETERLVQDLAQRLGLTRSGVVRLAVRRLHAALDQPPQPPTADDIAAQHRPGGGRRGPRPSRAYLRLRGEPPS